MKDKIEGCLVAGAAGDALGYTVEFTGSYAAIQAQYGPEGITKYDIDYPRIAGSARHTEALISDDTQMTLYTIEALLEAERCDAPLLPMITQAYLAWMGGQMGRNVTISYTSHLATIEALNQRRAPGQTCLTALLSIHAGEKPYNTSKGCGGVMRVAPIGIYGASHGWSLEDTARMAGDVAEITHFHPLSTYSSAALAVIVQLALQEEGEIDADRFKEIVAHAVEVVGRVYGDSDNRMSQFRRTVANAVQLAGEPRSDSEIIERQLGGGWVAEETLAIAIFSVLRHIDDLGASLICAVNHGGDSDSTGAVAGNIHGAILGYSAIPERFTASLQFHDLLLTMAHRICPGS
ncbi:MAG: ADP-ribosylglycohydrolase family protein [Muribaculaceae bacterium]|nr:ADP-ribosylglycohydrolase family protein [Muribaculaceae bacterium]